MERKLEHKENIINQTDDILGELFGVTLKICETVEDFDKLKKCLEMNIGTSNAKDFLPAEPIKVADMLINSTYTREKGDIEKRIHKAFGNGSDTVTENVYSTSELRQIAEHLLVYCNANESEEQK